MKRIKIDRSKCIGCLTCVSACLVSHESEESRNRVVISSEMKYSPIFCRNCDLPECVYTCMTGSMSKDEKTGYVNYNENTCASCYMCIMACPYGVLKADERTKKKIMKCDMCQNIGGYPKCVEKCPMAAITFEEVEE
ncbi:4Fe-4S dicluster domain-containing protein [Cetobacterium sp. 2A]|uniref:4Fe-4S dicluster domain-containing protein n=1 Tax=unclassified Cetobacterium TaxID=2630983 RepID=UPI00163CDA83|nr:4Fe-4S dicluster domain-containing protein [Cetobacterium sp. 2A]MBC2855136.1 4Fe-4S dicluster domain-containing protein [Cetobacterium sp. 2A]